MSNPSFREYSLDDPSPGPTTPTSTPLRVPTVSSSSVGSNPHPPYGCLGDDGRVVRDFRRRGCRSTPETVVTVVVVTTVSVGRRLSGSHRRRSAWPTVNVQIPARRWSLGEQTEEGNERAKIVTFTSQDPLGPTDHGSEGLRRPCFLVFLFHRILESLDKRGLRLPSSPLRKG